MWEPEKGVKFDALKERFDKLSEIEKAAEARKADVPEKADDYAFAAPADLKLPDGFQIAQDDIRWPALREMAKAEGWTKAEFQQRATELVKLDAMHQQHQMQMLKQATDARDKALGDKAQQRIDSLTTWVKGLLGDDIGGNMAFMFVTPEIVKGMETIQKALANQGVTSLNGTGRETGDQKIEGFEKMTFEQKWATAVPNRRAS